MIRTIINYSCLTVNEDFCQLSTLHSKNSSLLHGHIRIQTFLLFSTNNLTIGGIEFLIAPHGAFVEKHRSRRSHAGGMVGSNLRATSLLKVRRPRDRGTPLTSPPK